MKSDHSIMAWACALVLAACGGDGGGGGAGTETDGTTGTSQGTGTFTTGTMTTTLTTSSTTNPSSSSSTTGDQPDYWDDGICNGNQTPSSQNCMDIDFAGECTQNGEVIWCENGALFCIPCEANGQECGWVDAQSWYDCVTPTDPTTTTTDSGTSTSTGTGTSG